MNRDLASTMLTCAFGAFIGAFLGLEFAQRFSFGQYLWPLTAILGGFTAYVAVDFGHFKFGIARAYRATIAWKPNRLFWKAVVWRLMVGLAVGTLVFLFFGLLVDWMCGIILGLCMFFAFGPFSATEIGGNWHKNRLENEIEYSKSVVWNINPVAVLFWLGVGVFLGLTKGVPLIPLGLRKTAVFISRFFLALARFISTAFRYIHTKKRTLCFCDAALGAVVGYLAGSAAIGAIAGAVLGFVNYELVSVRWLKIVPVKRDA